MVLGTLHLHMRHLQRVNRLSDRNSRILAYSSSSTATRTRTGPVVKVAFKLPYRCRYGQNLFVVGRGEHLGNWEVGYGVEMKWNPGDVWSGEIAVAGSEAVDLEYKYVVREPDGHVSSWAPGSNFEVQVPIYQDQGKPADRIELNDAWDGAWHDIQVIVRDTLNATGMNNNSSNSNPPISSASSSSTSSSNGSKPQVSAALAKYGAEMAAAAADELLVLQKSMDKALANLSGAMDMHEHLLELVKDPADPAALEMDKRVAASFNRVMALSKAITASANEPLRLPGSARQ